MSDVLGLTLPDLYLEIEVLSSLCDPTGPQHKARARHCGSLPSEPWKLNFKGTPQVLSS